MPLDVGGPTTNHRCVDQPFTTLLTAVVHVLQITGSCLVACCTAPQISRAAPVLRTQRSRGRKQLHSVVSPQLAIELLHCGQYHQSPMVLSAHGMHTHVGRAVLAPGGAGFIASHVAIRLVREYPQYKVSCSKQQTCLCILKNWYACCLRTRGHKLHAFVDAAPA